MMINHWMIRSFDECEVDDHIQSLVEIMLDLDSFTRLKLTSLQINHIYIYIYPDWWFGTCFMFHYIYI